MLCYAMLWQAGALRGAQECAARASRRVATQRLAITPRRVATRRCAARGGGTAPFAPAAPVPTAVTRALCVQVAPLSADKELQDAVLYAVYACGGSLDWSGEVVLRKASDPEHPFQLLLPPPPLLLLLCRIGMSEVVTGRLQHRRHARRDRLRSQHRLHAVAARWRAERRPCRCHDMTD
jgi:hypothetical protein